MPVLDLTTIKTEKDETKFERFKKKVKRGWKNTKEYVKENPEIVIGAIGAGATIIGGTTKLVKSVNRNRQLRQEKFHRERQVYDHSLNMYLTTNRKLKKADFDRINAIRRKTGKRTSEVLSDLDLLEK